MSEIKEVKARQVLDSRGNPTVEVDVFLNKEGVMGKALVPSGASTGEYEACELRDGDAGVYLGKGVLKAIQNIHETIAPKIAGFEAGNQTGFDAFLKEIDGSENKSNMGANSLLALSIAYARATAYLEQQSLYEYFAKLSGNSGVTLPVPMMNILNGGAHADNNVDVQEIMIMPVGFDSFSGALQAGVEIFHHLKKVLKSKGLNTAVGDEGGFAPDLKSNAEALDVVAEATEKAGYKLGENILFALDVAASEFFKDGRYHMANEAVVEKTSDDMVKFYEDLCSQYPIASIEDGLDQDDWDGWKALTTAIGNKTQLVGDDLFVTNTKLLSKGISQDVANSVLIKMNQIGTLTETLECIAMAKKAGYRNVISHRSGETEDTTLADLAVGTDAGQIKTGSLCRTDRVAKYNRLLRIEEKLAGKAAYPGKKVFG